jgi:hypothetical protein
VVAADDAQLSKGKSSSDYDWYSPPLLLLFSFSLLLASCQQIIAVASITCNRRRSCRTWDYAARAFSKGK